MADPTTIHVGLTRFEVTTMHEDEPNGAMSARSIATALWSRISGLHPELLRCRESGDAKAAVQAEACLRAAALMLSAIPAETRSDMAKKCMLAAIYAGEAAEPNHVAAMIEIAIAADRDALAASAQGAPAS